VTSPNTAPAVSFCAVLLESYTDLVDSSFSELANGGAGSLQRPQIEAQLQRILKNELFLGSQRLCRFLRYLVDRALANELDQLKEFVVAIEVFDRPSNYDPSVDSIVRVEARRLRTKLKAYYEGPGVNDPVLIALRPGSYAPVFKQLEQNIKPSPVSCAIALSAKALTHSVIAVLPFVNTSPEPEQDFFCDGLTEEIISRLGAIQGITVVARSSVFTFKGRNQDAREVGAKLGANIIVEGGIRKAGQQLRITAQVIDARTGHHLWGERFSRQLEDVFAVQEELAEAIATALHVHLPQQPAAAVLPPPVDAYLEFMRARHVLNEGSVADMQVALDQMRDLTRRYPNYADPFAGIANSLVGVTAYGLVSGLATLPDLRHNAATAVRLNPESSIGWMIKGGLSAHWDGDWSEAETRFQRAIRLQPCNGPALLWYGLILAMLGRAEDANREVKAAVLLDPLSAQAHSHAGWATYLNRDLQSATLAFQRALAIRRDFPDATLFMGMIHIQREELNSAVEVLGQGEPSPLHLGLLAAAHGRNGDSQTSKAILESLRQMQAATFVSPLAFCFAELGGGSPEKALNLLRDAIRDRCILAQLTAMSPFADQFRHLPGFAKVREEMRLPS
jgi:adenylate cyclase